MRTKLPFAAIPLALCCWLGCGTEPKDKGDKLELTASPVPSPFRVGDTSGLWTASKTLIRTTGRAEKISYYTDFHLVVSDTGVAEVVAGRLLVGRKPGTIQVHAKDDRSDLVSESSVTVTVTAD